MLYTLASDNQHRPMVWDSDHLDILVGEIGEAIEKRIDINHEPRSFKDVFQEPVRVSFPGIAKEYKDKPIPDIADVQGRLFLNAKAYQCLHSLLENDGEFITLSYELGEAYFFIPLQVAENADALDTQLSRKNEWGDLEHMAFHENKVERWAVFRSMYNACMTLQCNENIKNAIEKAGLKGVFFTTDLGNNYANQFDEGVQVKN
ncbi:hypothetical protein [Agarilytica rhodophyticola]|uniref:hypothetical protein n=1 Tax=Agarilytica rhodophyticola TaxID=1737490 RepID=UPI000B343D2C|nr:hypothetical protein [Agarilytica rhodophyticola]